MEVVISIEMASGTDVGDDTSVRICTMKWLV